MLWYKAWFESRIRFGIALLVMVVACTAAVLFYDELKGAATLTNSPDTYAAYVYRVFYQGFLRNVFIVFTFVLGMGGLLRERELGTVSFTLALPVTRRALLLNRALVGIVELATLAAVPAATLIVISPVTGHTYAWSQAVQFAALWVAVGTVLFGVTFLASALFAGEYTAFLVAWVVFFGYTIGTQFVRLTMPTIRAHVWTLQEIMSGLHMRYFDPQSRMLVGPLPVTELVALVCVACALIFVATIRTTRSDF
jgi:ABC-type transport system involved in multi-copper enzyme maturation permease subunit